MVNSAVRSFDVDSAELLHRRSDTAAFANVCHALFCVVPRPWPHLLRQWRRVHQETEGIIGIVGIAEKVERKVMVAT